MIAVSRRCFSVMTVRFVLDVVVVSRRHLRSAVYKVLTARAAEKAEGFIRQVEMAGVGLPRLYTKPNTGNDTAG